MILKSWLSCRFGERAQALIHGDLHTSSVMVTCESTQVIDQNLLSVGLWVLTLEHFLGT